MSKDLEKYIILYFLVYIVVLAICGFFQYIIICQGKSLECAFSMSRINTIIKTTAYILTPIIAIIALKSWRTKHNKSIFSNEAKDAYKKLYDIKDYFNILKKLALIGNFHHNTDELKEQIMEELNKLQDKINSITEKVKFIIDLTGDYELQALNRSHQIKYNPSGNKILYSLRSI